MGLLGLFGIGTATYKLVKEALEPTLTPEETRYNLIKDDDIGTRVLKKQAFGWELTPEEERWYKQNFYTLKCPHCGTMNDRDSMWCSKCRKLIR